MLEQTEKGQIISLTFLLSNELERQGIEPSSIDISRLIENSEYPEQMSKTVDDCSPLVLAYVVTSLDLITHKCSGYRKGYEVVKCDNIKLNGKYIPLDTQVMQLVKDYGIISHGICDVCINNYNKAPSLYLMHKG